MAQARVFDMTRYVKSYPVTHMELLSTFQSLGIAALAFQLEQCPTTGSQHYQIRLQVEKKKTLSAIVALFAGQHMSHISITSTGGSRSFSYVMKTDTRVDGPWTEADYPPPIVEVPWQLETALSNPWPYQTSIMEMAHLEEHRTINVLYDPLGQMGKSTLADMLEFKGLGWDIPPHDKTDQLIASVQNRPHRGLYTFDVPRYASKKQWEAIYHVAEQVKRGRVYDFRNHYKGGVRDAPVVWIFCNDLPNFSKMAKDRWKIWTLDADFNLVGGAAAPVTVVPPPLLGSLSLAIAAFSTPLIYSKKLE